MKGSEQIDNLSQIPEQAELTSLLHILLNDGTAMNSFLYEDKLPQCLKDIQGQMAPSSKTIDFNNNDQIQNLLLKDNQILKNNHRIKHQATRLFCWFDSELKTPKKTSIRPRFEKDKVQKWREIQLNEELGKKLNKKLKASIDAQLPIITQKDNYIEFAKRNQTEIWNLKEILKNVGLQSQVYQVLYTDQLSKNSSKRNQLNKYDYMLQSLYDQQNKMIEQIQQEGMNAININQLTNNLIRSCDFVQKESAQQYMLKQQYIQNENQNNFL